MTPPMSSSMAVEAATIPQHIIEFIKAKCPQSPITSIEESKSAQQQVWIVSLSPTSTDNIPTPLPDDDDDDWTDALQQGRNRLVVRIWKAGSRWWNLHQAQDIQGLADAEVNGYRLARQALLERTTVYIPRVLHYESSKSTTPCPWALLEYVGPASTLFDDYNYDPSLVEGMVTMRHEFGFVEPHPRWGRVPVEESLVYATMVLKNVTIPLHKATRRTSTHQNNSDTMGHTIYLFEDMIRLYENALVEIGRALVSSATNDDRLNQAVGHLQTAIQCLRRSSTTIPPLPPVLVHMDVQPQNLLVGSSDDILGTRAIRSVLDWEEAAMADPRLDLLLICRKVVAHRQQADTLWEFYQQESQQALGDIEPWLQLETTHSITTLLLQSMDLLGGGRSPWETKSDLWGKLEREFHRLHV